MATNRIGDVVVRQNVIELKTVEQTPKIFSQEVLLTPLGERRKKDDAWDNSYYLDRQAGFESNARTYPRKLPIAICRAEGVYVEDADGRRYIDCLAGAGALALGHRHPVAVDAVQRAVADGTPWQTLDLTTPVKDAFVHELFRCFNSDFAASARIQFCGPSGADAIEAALKLVKTATGRRSILAFHGAYHGMTHGALGITGEIGPKASVAGLMPEVHFLPFPYSYRCPFSLGGEPGWRASLSYIDRLLADSNSGIAPPAAMILEAVQGEGGVIPAPDDWLRGMRRITRKYDIPLIIDEVQTGIGRTGNMFAFERAGIEPDVVVLSKAVGGGLPLSVVVYHENLDRWQPGAHAGTFRGNQLAMAAGAATLRFIREHRLDHHAEIMGERLMNHLRCIQAGCPAIGEVRGRGLMIGIEIIDPHAARDELGAHPPCSESARRIQRNCLKRGLILELGGRQGSVARLLPPLIVTENNIDQIAAIFREAAYAA
ncbi:aminotransferase class III-fold pyridoxal phosphate-dependent enzyme [Candidatus Methylospira mobilis]|uniref:Aminotransferase class III-fold pyridoxal phosphate-dependent enzyme n=1 Tax=Candidatus Methylospira mobilis TaxID=1808979 RepID=A0A5Q0BSA1_9GAMM|nr:aminotransferase class III-fold pyridoxal phosphate-dependent enzyme [Candidatus Methylospira mobilis]